jgi:hypothetical protein
LKIFRELKYFNLKNLLCIFMKLFRGELANCCGLKIFCFKIKFLDDVLVSLGPVARGHKTCARQEWRVPSDLFNFRFDDSRRDL